MKCSWPRAIGSSSRLLQAARSALFLSADSTQSTTPPHGAMRLALHPESDLMYSRMLFVSQRLAAAQSREGEGEGVDPDYLEVAHDELYRGQCHDAYSYAQSSSGRITEPKREKCCLSTPDCR